MRSITKRWGKWARQTAGRNGNGFYIRGYDRHNRNSEVFFTDDELHDLLYALLDVEKRG